jgi:hypothetical protein
MTRFKVGECLRMDKKYTKELDGVTSKNVTVKFVSEKFKVIQ